MRLKSDTAKARLIIRSRPLPAAWTICISPSIASAISGLSFNTGKVEQQLPAIRDNLNTIAENLSYSRSVQEVKTCSFSAYY